MNGMKRATHYPKPQEKSVHVTVPSVVHYLFTNLYRLDMLVDIPVKLEICVRWVDTVFKNSGVQQFTLLNLAFLGFVQHMSGCSNISVLLSNYVSFGETIPLLWQHTRTKCTLK